MQINTFPVMRTISVIAIIALSIISFSSCKNGKKPDASNNASSDVTTPSSQATGTQSDTANTQKDSTLASKASEYFNLDVEKIFNLIKEVSSDWKDDDGLKGQKAGLDFLKHTHAFDGDIELIAFYYGHNVRLVADSPNKFTSPNTLNAPVFTPNGSHAFYMLIGADACSGSNVFFSDKQDYDDFILKVNEYGLYKNDYGYYFVPATKTGMVQDFPANENNFHEKLMMSFEPMGLKDGWFRIILGLDF